MVIYADILIVLNLFVNYFIILASCKLLRRKTKTWRIFLGSAIGSLASLYIFLPEVSLLAEISFKLLLCFLISAVVYGIKSIKLYIRASGVIFLVTCAYAGIMLAIWKIFKPYGMLINNSVIYFNISPLNIVVFSVVSYVCFIIALKLFGRNNIYATECEIQLFYFDCKAEFKAIIDTGNSVSDIFGKSEIIIVDKEIVKTLFSHNKQNIETRYRAIPYNSVSGSGILDGYRCDSGIITIGNKIIKLKEPIIAASISQIKGDYSGIVNPEILD